MTTPTSLPARTLDSTPEEHLADHDALHALYSAAAGRAARSTVSAGLPTLTGRAAGDRHYDTTTGRDYVLTGLFGALVADNFDRADGPLAGTATSTGGKVWIASDNAPQIFGSRIRVSVNGETTGLAPHGFGSSDPVRSRFLWTRTPSSAGSGYIIMRLAGQTLTLFTGGELRFNNGNAINLSAPFQADGTVEVEGTWTPATNTISYRIVAPNGTSVTGSQVVTANVFDVNTGFTVQQSANAATYPAYLDDFSFEVVASAAWTDAVPVYLQSILAGTLVVGSNVLPPGFRVPKATTARQIFGRVGTAPTGAALTFNVERFNSAGVSQGTVGTVTIAAGSTTGSVTGLSVALAQGDILRVNVTAVGSTVAGADLNVSVDGW